MHLSCSTSTNKRSGWLFSLISVLLGGNNSRLVTFVFSVAFKSQDTRPAHHTLSWAPARVLAEVPVLLEPARRGDSRFFLLSCKGFRYFVRSLPPSCSSGLFRSPSCVLRFVEEAETFIWVSEAQTWIIQLGDGKHKEGRALQSDACM